MLSNNFSSHNNPDNTNELLISNIEMKHNVSSTNDNDNNDMSNKNLDTRIDPHISRIETSHNIVTKNDNDIDIDDNSVINKDNLDLCNTKELHVRSIDTFHDIRANVDNAININDGSVVNEDNLDLGNTKELQISIIEMTRDMSTNSNKDIFTNNSSVLNEDNLHLSNNNELQNSDISIEISHRMNTNSDEPIDINNSSVINTNNFDLCNTNQLQMSPNSNKKIDITDSSVVSKDNLDLGNFYENDSNLPPGLQLTSNALPNNVPSDDTFSKCKIDPFIDDTELRGSNFAMNVAASYSDYTYDDSFHRDIEIETNENNGKDLRWNDNKDDALKDAYLTVFGTDKEILYPESHNNDIDNLKRENVYIEVCLQEENEISNANNHSVSSGEGISTLNSASGAFKCDNLGMFINYLY
jgi:hypothetical protein